MKLWTYAEIKQKVQADLDLQEETFITPDELVGYCNEAIHEAESEILKINEDYFLSSTNLALVSGAATVALPSDIYGQKIRGIQYINGSTVYAVKRVRGGYKFDDLTSIQQFSPNDDYSYILQNPTAGAQSQILILPTPRETGNYGKIWYIRSAKRVATAAESAIQPTAPNTASQLATVLDIPEFSTFIIDFMKCRCLAKDGDARLEGQVAAMENQRKMMVESLTQQVPDDDDTVQMDLTHYGIHS